MTRLSYVTLIGIIITSLEAKHATVRDRRAISYTINTAYRKLPVRLLAIYVYTNRKLKQYMYKVMLSTSRFILKSQIYRVHAVTYGPPFK